jgi:pyruvate dehydrogenase E1 component alpha subunit
MAHVVPAEHDLRRVIGDGEAVPDGTVDGLGDDDLLALYRNLVLLRTYDERSVVYHRQGRIGTYAIFWNHEAMQVGSRTRSRSGTGSSPATASPRSAAARDPGLDDPLLVARPPGRLVEPGRLPRRVDLRPDRDARAARRRSRVGEEAARRGHGRDRVLRRRRHQRGRLPRGRQLRRRDARAVVLFCNNNQWAISTPLSAQTAAEALVDKAAGYGMPGVRVDGGDVLAVYEATRDAVERARAGDGPTFVEAVTYRAAPHATADDPSVYIDPVRVEEERANECVGRFERYLRRLGVVDDEVVAAVRQQALDVMRAGITAAEAEPPADASLLFEHALVDPPASFEHDLAELRRLGA